MVDFSVRMYDALVRNDGEIVVKTLVDIKLSPEERCWTEKLLMERFGFEPFELGDMADDVVEKARFDLPYWAHLSAQTVARKRRIAEGIANRSVERGLWTQEQADEFIEAVEQRLRDKAKGQVHELGSRNANAGLRGDGRGFDGGIIAIAA